MYERGNANMPPSMFVSISDLESMNTRPDFNKNIMQRKKCRVRFAPYRSKDRAGKELAIYLHNSNVNRLDPWFLIRLYGRVKEDTSAFREILQVHTDEACVQFYCEKNDLCFFVLTLSKADYVVEVCNRILKKSCAFLEVAHKSLAAPSFPIRSDQFEHIKAFLDERYDVDQRKLDLKHLSTEVRLRWNRIKLKLNKHYHMQVIVDYIKEHCPEIESLNLSQNGLENFDCLRHLVPHAPYLKYLYLGKNRIQRLDILEDIKDWKLESLQITGNPIVHQWKLPENDLISAVRMWFPNVTLLNGSFQCDEDPPLGLQHNELSLKNKQFPAELEPPCSAVPIREEAFKVVESFVYK